MDINLFMELQEDNADWFEGISKMKESEDKKFAQYITK